MEEPTKEEWIKLTKDLEKLYPIWVKSRGFSRVGKSYLNQQKKNG